ncbi:MAG TPA: addiction module protein [Thermoanaerobaculia bacterium]|nr:addiction module protein [Thermoanaerobaculia bacterium]
MTARFVEIRNAAMALGPNEREELAAELLDSLTGDSELMFAQEWLAEAHRRLDDLKSGRDRGLTIEEFFAAE